MLGFEPSSSTTTVLVINFAKVLDVHQSRIINEHQNEKKIISAVPNDENQLRREPSPKPRTATR
jgi:hypothetical protein